MDKGTLEKILIASIILLLPCVFYEKKDKAPKNPEKHVISSNLNNEATIAQNQDPTPVAQDNFSSSYAPPITPQTELNHNFNNHQPNTSAYQNVSYNAQPPLIPEQVSHTGAENAKEPLAVETVKPIEGEGFIRTSNYANPKLNYYYYYPSSFKSDESQGHPIIIAVPGLSGDGKAFVPQEMKDFAMKEGFGIVAPTFIEDGANFEAQKSYQYPAAWSGDAMMQILKDVENKGLKSSKLYLFGFSAGAQFASRFSFIHPQEVAACAINGSGARVWPESSNKVKYYIAVGNQDTDYRKQNAQIFYNEAIKLGISATHKQYNVGHSYTSAQILDELNFFKKVKNESM